MRANPAVGIAILVVHTALILDGAIRGIPSELAVLVMSIAGSSALDARKAFSAWRLLYRAGMSATVFSLSWPLALASAYYLGGKHNIQLVEGISNGIFVLGGPELGSGLVAMLVFKWIGDE